MEKISSKTFLEEAIIVSRLFLPIYIRLNQLIITHSLIRSILFAKRTENLESTKDKTNLKLNLSIQITLNIMMLIIMH
jgi:hypothetical protein